MITRTLNPSVLTAVWLLPVLALLQSSLAPHLAVLGIAPGLVVILIVDWGILRGTDEGMLWAFIAGICLDVFSGWPIGTNTVALVIVASLVSLGESTFMRTHGLVPVVTVFVATILYYGIAMFILESVQQPVDWAAAIKGTVVPCAVYNALLNVPAFRLIEWLEDRVHPMPRAHW